MFPRDITFFVDAEPQFLVNWLHQRTMMAYLEDFPTEKGRITLQSSRYNRQTGVASMEGAYILPVDETTEKAFRIGTAIEFRLTPLSHDRTEVRARCLQPVCSPYFDQLVSEISIRWPQRNLRHLSQSQDETLSHMYFLLAEIKLILTSQHLATVGQLQAIDASISQHEEDQASTLDLVRQVVTALLATDVEMDDESRRKMTSAEITAVREPWSDAQA